jgi:hypothetical protein
MEEARPDMEEDSRPPVAVEEAEEEAPTAASTSSPSTLSMACVAPAEARAAAFSVLVADTPSRMVATEHTSERPSAADAEAPIAEEPAAPDAPLLASPLP